MKVYLFELSYGKKNLQYLRIGYTWLDEHTDPFSPDSPGSP